MAFGEHAGLGLAEGHGATAAALHLAHQEEPEAEDQDEGEEVEQDGEHHRSALVLDFDGDALVGERAGEIKLERVAFDEVFAVADRGGDLSAVDDRIGDSAAFDLLDEVGIGHRLSAAGFRGSAHHCDQSHEEQGDDAQKRQIAHVHARNLSKATSGINIGHTMPENECPTVKRATESGRLRQFVQDTDRISSVRRIAGLT